MDKSTAIMELISSYDSYTEAAELAVSAAADAPATSPVCAISVASSTWCAAGASAVSGATYELTC